MALAKSNPVVAAVSAGVTTIDAIAGQDEEARADAYYDMAVGLMGVSAEILRAVKDGKVTDEEQSEIMRELERTLKDLSE